MSSLPQVTEEDITRRPEQLRKTARGGWAWKCSKCGQYASSLTQAGLRCYQHGGYPQEHARPYSGSQGAS